MAQPADINPCLMLEMEAADAQEVYAEEMADYAAGSADYDAAIVQHDVYLSDLEAIYAQAMIDGCDDLADAIESEAESLEEPEKK
jgi:hypothetical protein